MLNKLAKKFITALILAIVVLSLSGCRESMVIQEIIYDQASEDIDFQNDLKIAKSDENKFRFYSMSSQIQKNRKSYYNILEKTQKGSMDITDWLVWFLENLLQAISSSDEILANVIQRAEFWHKHSETIFNERQKKVLNRFMDNFEKNLTSTKWAKMCNCSQDTASIDIKDLINKKILKKVGDGRNTHYTLKK